jgi:hypothetical protein
MCPQQPISGRSSLAIEGSLQKETASKSPRSGRVGPRFRVVEKPKQSPHVIAIDTHGYILPGRGTKCADLPLIDHVAGGCWDDGIP